MVTLKDIAEKANVSIATVSRVLNNKAGSIGISEKTRQRVLQVARSLIINRTGWRSLRMGKTLKHILFIYVIGSQDDFFLHPFTITCSTVFSSRQRNRDIISPMWG